MLVLRTSALSLLLFSLLGHALVVPRDQVPEEESGAPCMSDECLISGQPLLAPPSPRGLPDLNPLTNRTYSCGQDTEIPITAKMAGVYNYIVGGAPGGGVTDGVIHYSGGAAGFVVGQVELTPRMGSVILRMGCTGKSGPFAGGGGGASTLHTMNRHTGSLILHAVGGGGGGAGTSTKGGDANISRNGMGSKDAGGMGTAAAGTTGGVSGTSGTGDAGGGGGGLTYAGFGVRGPTSGQGGQAIAMAFNAGGGEGASLSSPWGAGGFGGGGGAGRTTGGGGGGYGGGAGGSGIPGARNGGGGGGCFPNSAVQALGTDHRISGRIFFRRV